MQLCAIEIKKQVDSFEGSSSCGMMLQIRAIQQPQTVFGKVVTVCLEWKETAFAPLSYYTQNSLSK